MTTRIQPDELVRKELVLEEASQLKVYRESLFENAPVMMHSIDADGRLVDVNRLWLEKLGYEKPDVIGLPSADFLTGESRATALKDTLPLFWRTGRARSIGYTFVTKTGDHLDLLLDADKCPSILGMCTFAALRDPHSLLQWRQSSAILQALQELSYLQPPKDYDPTPALVNELGLATRGFERQPDGGPTAESPPRGPLPRITTRELEVLRLLASGNRNKEIADQLSLSVRTIRFHIENLYRKLEVNCRTQATRVAFERGYLKPI